MKTACYCAAAGLLIGTLAMVGAACAAAPADPVVKPVKVGGGFHFTEGPAVDPNGNLFFSDIPANRIHKRSPDGKITLFRSDSGAANGLAFDKAGNLLACEGARGRVTATDPEGNVTIVADSYQGKPFNQPNDLWIDPKGGVYFSDPIYGRAQNRQGGEHVYYVRPDRGEVLRVIDDLVRPNGLAGTADCKTLYVTDHGAKKTFRYAIQPDGTLADKRLFASIGADGMKVDPNGNVYLAEKGVLVYNAAGRRIAAIAPPEQPANLCLIDGGRSLFITAQTGVYTVALTPASDAAEEAASQGAKAASRPYTIVDTGQTHCFSDRAQLFVPPEKGQPFYGQDCFYEGAMPSYRDNGDGTIADMNTGLVWQKKALLDRKLTFAEALAESKKSRPAGHDDWRLPSIKELYSLIDFGGNSRARPPVAYIDTRFFEFRFGDPQRSERPIDSQYWSSTEYVGLTMRGDATVFGVNFADGRIKGYPRDRSPRGPMRQYVRLYRGNPQYGKNRFVDNGDGTISDGATGLMWAKADSGKTLNWEQSLSYAARLALAGHRDWRLPNAKELQSIVDYTRAPDAQDASRRTAAIDPSFEISSPESYLWTSTTHREGGGGQGAAAVYIAFGRAMGFMTGRDGVRRALNVHGAGAQRSDPKSGDPRAPQWAGGMGPQGDEIRILNYARAVRNIDPAAVRLAEPNRTPLPATPRGPKEKPGAFGQPGAPGFFPGFPPPEGGFPPPPDGFPPPGEGFPPPGADVPQ